MEKVFYTCGGENLEEINQVLASGGKVKSITAAGGRDYKSTEAYIVVELPPQTNQII